jgi:hypothetical protein
MIFLFYQMTKLLILCIGHGRKFIFHIVMEYFIKVQGKPPFNIKALNYI